jgi:hypothetical protein
VKRLHGLWRGVRSGGQPILVWLWVAFVVFVIGTTVVLDEYGGLAFFPGLIGGFGASLFAFMLALRWDHEREHERARAEAEERAVERERQATKQHDQVVIEAQRRLEPIRKELGRNKESVEQLAKSLPAAMNMNLPPMAVNPQLLEGAWAANAPRLSEILSDYNLVGDLAFTYGRIEELRWRLRQRTALLAVNLDIAQTIATMTDPLVKELLTEVNDCLVRVGKAIDDPPVRDGHVLDSPGQPTTYPVKHQAG